MEEKINEIYELKDYYEIKMYKTSDRAIVQKCEDAIAIIDAILAILEGEE